MPVSERLLPGRRRRRGQAWDPFEQNAEGDAHQCMFAERDLAKGGFPRPSFLASLRFGWAFSMQRSGWVWLHHRGDLGLGWVGTFKGTDGSMVFYLSI